MVFKVDELENYMITETLSHVNNALTEKGYDVTNLQAKNVTVHGTITNSNILRMIAVILVALVAVMIYLWLRIGLLNFLCVLATTIQTVLVMVSLMIITRVQVNLNSFAVVAGIAVLSIIISTLNLSDINSNKLLKIDEEKLSMLPLRNSNIVFYGIIAVSLIALMFFGSVAFNYAILGIIGLISLIYSVMTMTIPAWFTLSKYEVKEKPVVKEDTETEENE